jgi:quinol monooxygenase YgiN
LKPAKNYPLPPENILLRHEKQHLLRKEYPMSVARIGETQAKPETIQALRGFLISIMPGIKSSPGCASVTLYQSQDDSTKFTMVEIWDSIESHQASVKNIPPEMLAEIMPLLASAPRGGYYDLVHDS